MAELITRTIYGSTLQTNQLLGLPHEVWEFSTLNEYLNVQSRVLPSASQTPKLCLYGIGNGGHIMATGPGGVQYPKGLQHKATDANCFNLIPMILREPTNDLTPGEQALFAGRREEIHQGLTWIAYYFAWLPTAGVKTQAEYHVVKDGVDKEEPFVPDSSNLNPVPSSLTPEGVNVLSGDYVSTTARTPVMMDAWRAAELLNVSRVMWDTDELAIISEMIFCSAVEKVIQIQVGGGATRQFKEAVAVQAVSHYSCFFPMKYNNNGVELLVDMGATEPLFAKQTTGSVVTTTTTTSANVTN